MLLFLRGLFVVAVVLLIVAVSTACAPVLVKPDGPARIIQPQDNLVISLYTTPCAAPVVDLILEQFRRRFQRADVRFEGKNYRACWAALFADEIYVIDEIGEQGPVSLSPPASRSNVPPQGSF